MTSMTYSTNASTEANDSLVAADLSVTPLHAESAGFHATLKGEDAHSILIDSRIGDDRVAAMMIADGHGGKQVAQHASKHIIQMILNEAEGGSAAELERAVRVSFSKFHQMVQAAEFGASGCTCTVALVNLSQSFVFCANVGDSALIAVDDEDAALLTTDHRFEDNEAERERVRGKGATLGQAVNPATRGPGGPLRAWPGGLAMGHAFGNPDCATWISAEPACTCRPIPASGVELVLCTDGVWDALSVGTVGELAAVAVDPLAVAKMVVNNAVKERGLRDDTTCVSMRVGAAGSFKSAHGPKRAGGIRGALSRLGKITLRQRLQGQGSDAASGDMDSTVKGGKQFVDVANANRGA